MTQSLLLSAIATIYNIDVHQMTRERNVASFLEGKTPRSPTATQAICSKAYHRAVRRSQLRAFDEIGRNLSEPPDIVSMP